jgi:Tfx family DNA-binding protein
METGQPSVEETVLTERQVEVLRLREEGRTQREVAETLDTTPSNISAVEKAARANIEKARRTLDLVNVIRAPARLHVESGTPIEEIVDAIYDKGDVCGITIDYPHPELYSHLYTQLTDEFVDGRLMTAIEIGITREGSVRMHPA